LALLALAVRLPQLGARPMHTDEAVNAYLTGDLLAGQAFHYDPRDRHGPLLFAVAGPLARGLGARTLAGLTEFQLRLTPVIIGSLTVLLFGAGMEMFGFIPCLVAALLFAFAPLTVYYSRYFIHETLFVAITLALMLSGWNAWQKGTRASAALAGLCAGLLLACKETAVLHFLALAAAVTCGIYLQPRPKAPPARSLAAFAGAFLLVTILLFTWFCRNWAVFGDLLRAVPRFAARAQGEGHEKPFGYYFHLLDPMLVLTIVAIGGAYAAVCNAVNQLRKPQLLLIIYGLVIFLIYSAIPYKTPWLALNLWLPLALACGFGVEAVWEQMANSAGRWVAVIAGAFLLAILGAQTKLLAFDRPADEHNPFAYAHTVEDLLRLPPRLEQLAAEMQPAQPRIAVIAADAWPLPWYLRKFPAVGYWQPGQDPGPADFYLTTTDVPAKVAARLKHFDSEFFGVRPDVLLLLWVPAKDQ
jgi:uncharacterized protein (TIGR03663 family)